MLQVDARDGSIFFNIFVRDTPEYVKFDSDANVHFSKVPSLHLSRMIYATSIMIQNNSVNQSDIQMLVIRTFDRIDDFFAKADTVELSGAPFLRTQQQHKMWDVHSVHHYPDASNQSNVITRIVFVEASSLALDIGSLDFNESSDNSNFTLYNASTITATNYFREELLQGADCALSSNFVETNLSAQYSTWFQHTLLDQVGRNSTFIVSCSNSTRYFVRGDSNLTLAESSFPSRRIPPFKMNASIDLDGRWIVEACNAPATSGPSCSTSQAQLPAGMFVSRILTKELTIGVSSSIQVNASFYLRDEIEGLNVHSFHADDRRGLVLNFSDAAHFISMDINISTASIMLASKESFCMGNASFTFDSKVEELRYDQEMLENIPDVRSVALVDDTVVFAKQCRLYSYDMSAQRSKPRIIAGQHICRLGRSADGPPSSATFSDLNALTIRSWGMHMEIMVVDGGAVRSIEVSNADHVLLTGATATAHSMFKSGDAINITGGGKFFVSSFFTLTGIHRTPSNETEEYEAEYELSDYPERHSTFSLLGSIVKVRSFSSNNSIAFFCLNVTDHSSFGHNGGYFKGTRVEDTASECHNGHFDDFMLTTAKPTLTTFVRWQNINVTENGKYIQLHHSFHPGLNPGDQLRLSDASGLQYPQCKHLSSACEQFLCRWEDTRCSPSQCHHAQSKVNCSSFGDGCVWGQKQYDVTSTEFSSDISSGRSWATLELAMNDDKFSNVENSTTYRVCFQSVSVQDNT